MDLTAVDGVRQPVSTSLDIETKTPEELEEEIRREAFDAAITGLFPMRPNEIKEVLRQYDTTTRAVEEPVYGIPTPKISVETISLDPGVAPMTLKTATGHITTLSLLDATGAPWPIQDIGWAGDFEVIEPEEGGHIIRITPMAIAAYGNMSIRLLGLKTPVTIMLTTSKDEVQYRVDARIAEFGPQSAPQIIEGGSEIVAGNDTIMSILDGTPPNGATRLAVGGVDGRTTAYKLNNMTYVRTPLTLLSPGWQQSVTSADGMNVYALNDTPVLLLSDKGRFTRASVKTEEDPFDE
jgi:intracellular multiplication protein IcmK